MDEKNANQVKKKKRIVDCFWKQCVVFVVLMTIIISSYAVADSYVSKELDLKNLVEDDFSFVFQIDEIKDDGKNVVLDGWAFKLDVDATEEDMEVMLYDMESEKIVYPEIEHTVREDVNDYFLCEYDYLKSGFVATFISKKLDAENKEYEVLILDKESEKIYKTGTYISNGELMYTNPNEYVPLDVEGTDLEKIVNEGVLRVYCPDEGMYVYQYEGHLYWIADDTYTFEADASTYVQYQMWTTQIKNLPQHRLENEWYWDNIGFNFEDKELKFGTMGNYRVTISELPTGYSLTKIVTGYHVENWIWKQYFRPWYDFEMIKNEE